MFGNLASARHHSKDSASNQSDEYKAARVVNESQTLIPQRVPDQPRPAPHLPPHDIKENIKGPEAC
jgi:hypothetical protein